MFGVTVGVEGANHDASFELTTPRSDLGQGSAGQRRAASMGHVTLNMYTEYAASVKAYPHRQRQVARALMPADLRGAGLAEGSHWRRRPAPQAGPGLVESKRRPTQRRGQGGAFFCMREVVGRC